MGGFVATYSYLATDAPRYVTGNSIQLGMLFLYAAMTALLMFLNFRENRLRDRGGRDYRLTDGKVPEDELGMAHPSYRFSL